MLGSAVVPSDTDSVVSETVEKSVVVLKLSPVVVVVLVVLVVLVVVEFESGKTGKPVFVSVIF